MHATTRGETDIGQRREHNEDTFLVDNDLGLAIVADGMGGHACGEIASQLAATAFRDAVSGERETLTRYAGGEASADEVHSVLESAMLMACNTVYEAAESEPSKHGMGTTCTAVVLAGDRLFGAHVGDSRLYLVRDERALQLTRDHTVLAQLVALGRITEEQAAGSSYAGYRNALARAVGVTPEVEVDTLSIDVLPGDVMLLASDGLTSYLEPDEIAEVASRRNEDLAERLIAIANDRGGHDNITVVTMRVSGDESDEACADLLASKLAALRRVPMFALLEPERLLEVSALAEIVEIPEDTYVVRKGEAGDALYAVLEGTARVASEDDADRELGAGEFFGEFTLLDVRRRATDVVTTEPCRLLRLDRASLAVFLERSPQVGVQLLWSLARFVSGHAGASAPADDTADAGETGDDPAQAPDGGSGIA